MNHPDRIGFGGDLTDEMRRLLLRQALLRLRVAA